MDSTNISWTPTATRRLPSTLRYGLIVSFLLLVSGLPSTPAYAYPNACTPYTGDAHRICTAAITAGCFAATQSPDCDALTLTWNERCDDCEGPAPWGPECPCNLKDSTGTEFNAADLFAELLSMGGFPIWSQVCKDTRNERSVYTWGINQDADSGSGLFGWMDVKAWRDANGVNKCTYDLMNPTSGNPMYLPTNKSGLSLWELGACRKDIKTLIEQLNASPFFCGYTLWP
jgi:hypothetical protein